MFRGIVRLGMVGLRKVFQVGLEGLNTSIYSDQKVDSVKNKMVSSIGSQHRQSFVPSMNAKTP